MSSRWIIICIFFIAENIYWSAPERAIFTIKLITTASFDPFFIAAVTVAIVLAFAGFIYIGTAFSTSTTQSGGAKVILFEVLKY